MTSFPPKGCYNMIKWGAPWQKGTKPQKQYSPEIEVYCLSSPPVCNFWKTVNSRTIQLEYSYIHQMKALEHTYNMKI